MKYSDLTAEEQVNVRTALKFLRVRAGGRWEPLATALRTRTTALSDMANGHRIVSASMTFRIARLAKVGVDDLISGRYPPPNTCPHCGQTLPTEAPTLM